MSDMKVEGRTMTSKKLLYTDESGQPSSLEDIISDGLDGAYKDRIPALTTLMAEGAPDEKLAACRVLVSWGLPKGFEQLVAWCHAVEAVPWAENPVDVDRKYRVDAAFELLADAVRASLILQDTEELRARQIDATRALLQLYDHKFFNRMLVVVLQNSHIRARCKDATLAAADAAVRRSRQPREPFDLAVQAASLLEVVALFDDDRAAALAVELARMHPTQERVEREITFALARTKGAATGRVLRDLVARSPSAARALASIPHARPV